MFEPEEILHRTIVRIDTVCFDHYLLVICGWSAWVRVSRPLNVFGSLERLLIDGDKLICWVNVAAEHEDDLVFDFESICPSLEPQNDVFSPEYKGKHIGGSLDALLEKEGIKNEVEVAAKERVKNWTRQQKLGSAGWKTGNHIEFLELTGEEAILIENQINTSRCIRAGRPEALTFEEGLERMKGTPLGEILGLE